MSTIHNENEEEFSLKSFFVPLTTLKAIHIIIIVSFIVYFYSFFNGFVWDDIPQYINNPNAHSLFNIPQILTDRTMSYYRPVPTIIFAAAYSLFGETALWYHLLQLILHIVNTILMYFLLKKFVPNTISLFFTIIFLIHPMNVESVAYISSMQTVLSLMFGLSSLFVIENKKLIPIYKYGLIFLLLLLSVLSKETGWIFFFLLPCFMFLEKLNNNINYHKNDYISLGISCLGVLVLYISIIVLIPAPSDGTILAPFTMLHASLVERLITLPKIIFYYLFTFIYPINLGVTQQWIVTQIDFQGFILPLVIDILFFTSIFVAGIILARKSRKKLASYLFFTSWFLLSFGFAWQFIPLTMTVADRWFYFPMMGLLGMVGVFLSSVKIKSSTVKNLLISLLIVLILGYSIRTIIRVADWKDGITLFSHDRAVSYNSFDLYDNLGYNYLILQRYDEAKPHLEEAVRLEPNSWESWGNLGTYYGNTGQIDKAVELFKKSIEVNPNYYVSYVNITRLYYLNNKLPETKNFLEKIGLVRFPQDPYLLSVKGAIDYRLGNKQKGMDELKKAYDISKDPFYLNMYNLMQQNQDISNIR